MTEECPICGYEKPEPVQIDEGTSLSEALKIAEEQDACYCPKCIMQKLKDMKEGMI
jgi:predicted RNA-binding Zn-ribbon protein involved in translation (DUF1610 family)